MRYQIIVLLFLNITLFGGCSIYEKNPQYKANWSKLKIGMSKQEVIEIIGKSYSRSIPKKFYTGGNIPDPNLPRFMAKKLPNEQFFYNFRYEVWQYRKFDLFNNLRFPSDNAYVIYFDKDGKVASFREPLSYWEKSPYYFKDVSTTHRIGGDYLESFAKRSENLLIADLEPPTLLYPDNFSVFCHFPREIVFRWQPSRDTSCDVEYLVQIQDTWKGDYSKFGDWPDELPSMTYRTGKTLMNERFVGAQPGRWRVKTIDKRGESKWSEWQYFRFTR